jgi:hypothetical protein
MLCISAISCDWSTTMPLRQSAQARIAAVQELQFRHLDGALMVRNHGPREVAVSICIRCNAHRRIHLDHDSLQRTMELARCDWVRNGEPSVDWLR